MAQEILVSINVNSGKAEARLKGVKKATDQTKISTELYEKSINDLTQAELRQIIAEQKVVVQRKITTKSVQQLAAAELSAAEAAKGNRAQSGLSNAILLESGRLASDASYGFTAIANNLSQLVTLMQSFAETSGGFRNSLKRLGESLMGSAGLLIVLQLLISFGPKLYDFFRGAAADAEKFKKALDEATKSINLQKVELMGYLEVLKDTSVSEAVRLNATQEIAEALPHLVDEQGKLKVSYEDLNTEIEKYIEQSLIRAEIDVLLEQNEEKFRLRRQLRNIEEIEDEEERLKARMAFMEKETGFFEASAYTRQEQRKRARMTQEERDIQDFTRFSNRIESQAKLVVDQIEALQRQLEGKAPATDSGGRGKLDRQATFKLYEIRLNDFDRYAQKAIKKELGLIKRTAIQKLDLQKKFAIEELDLRARTALENEKVRYQEYISDLNLRKQSLLDRAETEKQKAEIITEFTKAEADANRKYTKTIQDLGVQFEKTTTSILGSYGRMQDEIVDQQRLDDLKMFADESIKGIQDRIAFEQDYSREKSTQLELEKKLLDSVFKQDLANLNAKIAKAKIDGDAYEGLIQRKINLEKTYGEETKRIARETDDAVFASKLQLASSIADIMEESSRLAKEGSDLQKALSLTAIAANTSVSMIQGFRLAQEASQGTGPAAPFVAAATYAAQVATLLSAVNQAKSILSSGDVSGISSSVNVQAPAFNVVGASPLDLLMVDISSKLDKPIPAYISAKGALNTLDEFYRNVRTGSNS